MKKLINPQNTGGAPFTNEAFFELFQSEIYGALESLLKQYQLTANGEFGIICSGCEVTPNASNFDISAGIVYLNGEFMRLPAATNQTFTKYIAAKTPTFEQKTFFNGATQNFAELKEAELVSSAPGTGHYITISSLTSANPRYLKAFNSGMVYVDSAGNESFKVIRQKMVEIGSWNMDTTSELSIPYSRYNIPHNKIRDVRIIIFTDSGTVGVGITGISFATAGLAYYLFGSLPGTSIVIERSSGSYFDSATFDDTGVNRGYIIITYEE